jgi:hypothetical protein
MELQLIRLEIYIWIELSQVISSAVVLPGAAFSAFSKVSVEFLSVEASAQNTASAVL